MTDQITIDPKTTAVLLLHFQFGTLSAGEALPLAEAAAPFADRMRAAGATIGFVNIGFDEADAAAVPASNPMLAPLVGAGMMRIGSPEASNPPALTPQEGDIVVRNTRFGTFSTSPIEAELASRGIRTLVLAGVATGAVVVTTALEASDRDYEVIVVSDLVADPDPSVQSAVLDGIIPRIGRAVLGESIVV
ncbi:MAG: cysteine hydrolase family protein [Leucobacter sp.]